MERSGDGLAAPVHGCSSEAGADRPRADAWSSSFPTVFSASAGLWLRWTEVGWPLRWEAATLASALADRACALRRERVCALETSPTGMAGGAGRSRRAAGGRGAHRGDAVRTDDRCGRDRRA